MTINTPFNTTLPGFSFSYNDPNNSVNGRAVGLLASIGGAGSTTNVGQPGFGTAPGAIPGTTNVPSNVRADGLALTAAAAAQIGTFINNSWLPTLADSIANIGAQTN